MTQFQVVIAEPTGMHARPAAQLVQLASRYQSKVSLTANNRTVDARSLLGIMSLGAACGTEVSVCIEGVDETECRAALHSLMAAAAG